MCELRFVTVLQIDFNVTLSPSVMQIHHTFLQLITVLISQCVMWMTANVSFMHLFPNGVRQLFKSKVRRTSFVDLREQIAKLQTEVGCQISLWKCIFFHCFSFSQTTPYCSYRAGGHIGLSTLFCTAVLNQTVALFWVFASCGGCAFLQSGRRWHSWLRHCATSRKVAGSIRYNLIGIFHWRNPSGCTMALGSTQPLIEMSTRNISWWAKVAGT